MKIQEKSIVIDLNNGEKWKVPLLDIIANHANYHRNEFNSFVESFDSSLEQFESDIFSIYDWVRSMYWYEIETHATKIKVKQYDYDELLMNSNIEIE